ncbi:MAG: repeat protein, partial [Armatimonadetes bacterium]|nr:repeat protein [Armatimonadota bacterium]
MRLLESVGFGAGFVDFDQDGHLDVFLVGAPTCALYRNQGDGTFQPVPASAGLGARGDWIGCATCDFDNDGWPDLYVTGYLKSALYRNRGDGTFEDVTRRAGVAMTGKWATAAT